eukprot:PhM_4_TR16753/c0_g1_i3/m.66753
MEQPHLHNNGPAAPHVLTCNADVGHTGQRRQRPTAAHPHQRGARAHAEASSVGTPRPVKYIRRICREHLLPAVQRHRRPRLRPRHALHPRGARHQRQRARRDVAQPPARRRHAFCVRRPSQRHRAVRHDALAARHPARRRLRRPAARQPHRERVAARRGAVPRDDGLLRPHTSAQRGFPARARDGIARQHDVVPCVCVWRLRCVRARVRGLCTYDDGDAELHVCARKRLSSISVHCYCRHEYARVVVWSCSLYEGVRAGPEHFCRDVAVFPCRWIQVCFRQYFDPFERSTINLCLCLRSDFPNSERSRRRLDRIHFPTERPRYCSRRRVA